MRNLRQTAEFNFRCSQLNKAHKPDNIQVFAYLEGKFAGNDNSGQKLADYRLHPLYACSKLF